MTFPSMIHADGWLSPASMQCQLRTANGARNLSIPATGRGSEIETRGSARSSWRSRSCGMAPTIGSGCSPSPPGDRRVRRVHFGNHRVGDGVPRWPGRAGHFRSNQTRRDLGPSRGNGRSRILRTPRTSSRCESTPLRALAPFMVTANNRTSSGRTKIWPP